ncbi:MAG: FKBP-type peptidyl-prolyl cis-trans isomerase [Phycisphaerales bacterium]|nr:FKBP-type peptidyl-prolyl cis-trans isomerase [Phycisphaerae bacterium]NNF44095.1 FKBP-type peptidyl-prolyl cis-trans isomerase [Phycisphaerales bacterium]NNM26486.1 FKBP-type peptidyl-prolyl cis-trans isomerase [Phycisphaerales bacterium]
MSFPRFAVLGCAIVLTLASTGGCEQHEDVRVDETRLSIVKDQVGRGRPARRGDIVCIDFEVHTQEGEELLWGKDFCYQLGAGVVVAGFDEGVVGMQKGGRRQVLCPAHMHWGRGGYADKIPAHTALLMDIRLVSVE